MLNSNEERALIEKLHKIYKEKGFVSEELVLNSIIEYNLPLDKIEYVCDRLLSMGIIISDDSSLDEPEEDDMYDRSKTDYEQLFNEVVAIDENLKHFIDEIRQIKPPQFREWQNLMPQAKNNNVYAKNRIVTMYLRAVVKIALAHHKKYKIPLAEAIQDGCVGLVIALDKFEGDSQGKFSSYSP